MMDRYTARALVEQRQPQRLGGNRQGKDRGGGQRRRPCDRATCSGGGARRRGCVQRAFAAARYVVQPVLRRSQAGHAPQPYPQSCS
jgi:hypothetical protein